MHKGNIVVDLLFVAVFLVTMIVGFVRVGRESGDRVLQLIYYGFIMLFVVGLTVGAICYSVSTPVAYEKCYYVSKTCSSLTKGGKSYYIDVRLQDGSVYNSYVPIDMYSNAQYADLYLCREENPFGIEYWHVCVGK